MIWRQKSSKRAYWRDFLFSQEIIFDAYSEGFINWNVYQKAMEKIKSNMNSMENGGGLFGEGNEKIDFSKEYED